MSTANQSKVSRLSLKQRLLMGFLISAFFLLGVGGLNYYSLHQVTSYYSHISGMNLPDVIAISEMRDSVRNIRGILARIVIPGIPANFLADAYKGYEDAVQKYEKYSELLNQGEKDADELKDLKAAQTAWERGLGLTREMIRLSKTGVAADKEKFIHILLYEYRPVVAEHVTALDTLTQYHQNDAKHWTKLATDLEKRSLLLTVLAVLGGFGLSSVLGYQLATRLTRDLRRMSQRLAEGASEVSQASATISSTSNQLSASATEQAAALQETVASVDQVNAMVGKNAENAKRSQAKSTESERSANRGREVVETMLHSMEEINQSNTQILQQVEQSNKEMGAIVKVIGEIGNKTKIINDIVFQTKLLSFNASVEAARAGEAGKGFSVVAEEVGKLAQMSGKAAHEISAMLDSSMQKVEAIASQTQGKVEGLVRQGREKVQAGTETARRCAEVLSEIVGEVKEVNSLVGEIAQASHEQALGVGEINKAMGQLDQVTQENSKAAQHTASAATQLQSQAEGLSDIVQAVVQLVEGGDATSSRQSGAVAQEDASPSGPVRRAA